MSTIVWTRLRRFPLRPGHCDSGGPVDGADALRGNCDKRISCTSDGRAVRRTPAIIPFPPFPVCDELLELAQSMVPAARVTVAGFAVDKLAQIAPILRALAINKMSSLTGNGFLTQRSFVSGSDDLNYALLPLLRLHQPESVQPLCLQAGMCLPLTPPRACERSLSRQTERAPGIAAVLG